MYDPTKPYIPEVLQIIKTTWAGNHIIQMVEPNTFRLIYHKSTADIVDHTDGIGTKGLYHWRARTFAAAAQDAMAMNLNDLAAVGARAFKLSAYLSLPQDNHDAIIAVTTALAKECNEFGVAYTGGETAIINTLDGMELSLMVSGYRDDCKFVPSRPEPGDVILGLASNGLHSNGFTRVREIFPDINPPELTAPTEYYYEDVLRLTKNPGNYDHLRFAEHIAGGAFARLKKHLHKCDALIDLRKLEIPAIFHLIQNRGRVYGMEMLRTFNCGIGMILVVPKVSAEYVLKHARMEHPIHSIGSMRESEADDGLVIIKSPFGDAIF